MTPSWQDYPINPWFDFHFHFLYDTIIIFVTEMWGSKTVILYVSASFISYRQMVIYYLTQMPILCCLWLVSFSSVIHMISRGTGIYHLTYKWLLIILQCTTILGILALSIPVNLFDWPEYHLKLKSVFYNLLLNFIRKRYDEIKSPHLIVWLLNVTQRQPWLKRNPRMKFIHLNARRLLNMVGF